jgi:hypothetical protein
MIFDDSIDAIAAAATDGRQTGHDLRGFTRRTGSYGYRFVARCRTCGHEIVISRVASGWGYAALESICSAQAARSRWPGTVSGRQVTTSR